MNKETAQALEKSIEHWYENLQMLELNYLSGYNLGFDIYTESGKCALCGLFAHKNLQNISVKNICTGCPVAKRIPKRSGMIKCPCAYTPYQAVVVWHYWRHPFYFDPDRKKVYDEGFKLISDELEFLISLRKK
jgi:hypothetical protein